MSFHLDIREKKIKIHEPMSYRDLYFRLKDLWCDHPMTCELPVGFIDIKDGKVEFMSSWKITGDDLLSGKVLNKEQIT